MFVIPFAHFSMSSTIAQEVIAQRLFRVVFSPETDSDEKNSYEYQGAVYADEFAIRRNLNFSNPDYPWVSRRNAFVPLIEGRIHSNSRTSVTIRFDALQTLFSLLWYSIIVVVTVGYIQQSVPKGTFNWGALFAPFLFSSTLYVWQIVSFNYEAKKAVEFLERIAGLRKVG